jgi:hypothetical protein
MAGLSFGLLKHGHANLTGRDARDCPTHGNHHHWSCCRTGHWPVAAATLVVGALGFFGALVRHRDRPAAARTRILTGDVAAGITDAIFNVGSTETMLRAAAPPGEAFVLRSKEPLTARPAICVASI